MIQNERPDEVALNRYKIISSIIVAEESGCDREKISQMKQEICKLHGLSERTLRRWLSSYRENSFEGLKPIPRNNSAVQKIPEEIIDEAIVLRREVPSRSISTIIEILEFEGKVPKGLLKRTTLQDRMVARGYSSRQIKMYNQRTSGARRYVRKLRNDLWHSDIKYGPYITINGEKKQIYLVAFLDDATRYVIHAEFFASLDQTIVENAFRSAIAKEGIPRRVYFDNGKQYRTRFMERACAILGVKLLFAKPYSPESKGKIERFNRTFDSFLDEVKLKKLGTLDEYNEYLQVWIQECYQSKRHSGLIENKSKDEQIYDTPELAYQNSNAPLRFLQPETIAQAFMHSETRKVDKSGCISFESKKYEVGLGYVGSKITIVFDSNNKDTILREDEETHKLIPIKALKIGEYSAKGNKLPETLNATSSSTSRLLDAKKAVHEETVMKKRRAISFYTNQDNKEESENV